MEASFRKMGSRKSRSTRIVLLVVLTFALCLVWTSKLRSRLNELSHNISLADDYATRMLALKQSRLELSRMAERLVAQKSHALNYTATIVLGRLDEEEDDVDWVYDKLRNIDNPHIYIVNNNQTSEPHLDINHGREAHIYMKYIVENYDRLHDVTFFWHSQETTWHNNILLGSNSAISINLMDRENIIRRGYVPSRCDQWPGCPTWIRYNPTKFEHRSDPHKLEKLFSPAIMSQLFPGVQDFPPYFAGTCCSQFAVSRDQIRSRPRAHYDHLLKWAVEYPDDEESGRVFEFLWPYIFTGKGTLCPTMQDCYCETYNLCIDNPKDIAILEHWNALRTRREELHWNLVFAQQALEVEHIEHKKLGATSSELLLINSTFEPEIDKLSDDLDDLEDAVWDARQQVLQRWRVVPPPQGW